MRFSHAIGFLAAVVPALSCESCYGPRDSSVHVRNVKRMQPGALNATASPRAPLAWGQLNVLHTTDTHGWLEGHLKEANYGADWGDFVSFSRHMVQRAGNLGVDLLLIDTGDLHDGNGLSDAERPDGSLSNPIFDEIQYDLLTIGNHELYVSEVAYLTLNQFAKVWGGKYLTSNVEIMNPTTGEFEYIGAQYRYFTTQHGLRIMAFGVLYDFTGNSNVSRVTKAATMVQQAWFLAAVNTPDPVDLFMVIGHNPARTTTGGSTFGTVYKAIRALRPDVPIQTFGGHSHVRDFAVYDAGTTGMESGRYCETLGWFSMGGIAAGNFTGNKEPRGVPNPTQKAVKVTQTSAAPPTATASVPAAFKDLVYSRRYLDWNRRTFAYHAVGSQSATFDYHSGLRVSAEITSLRNRLNITALFGCVPATYCVSCVAFGAPGSAFPVLSDALGLTVVNASRADIPRLIVLNTGSVRFDLFEGPFTYDDSFIVSPFTDAFQYIPNVPYKIASQVLATLNAAPASKARRRGDLSPRDFGFAQGGDSCVEAVERPDAGLVARDAPLRGGKHRRQTTTAAAAAPPPGYTTADDFGADGDDTVHAKIPFFRIPEYFQANASLPADGSAPATVDLVFLDYIAQDVVPALTKLGAGYTEADISYYLPTTFTTNSYLPLYAKLAWQKGVPNCPIGAAA